MRTQDWSYHDQRAAVLLAQGSAEAASAALNHADTLVTDWTKGGENCLVLQLNKLRNREQALYEQSQRYPENEQIRNELGKAQSQIWALQNDHESSPCN